MGATACYYHFAGIYLADGRGFINPSLVSFTGMSVPDALHPPAWTTVLAVPSALGLRSWLSHQLIACAVGTATIVMTGLAGRVAFGRRAGLIAAALVAIYPNVWLYEREVQAETLALLGAATTIWLAYRFRAAPGVTNARAARPVRRRAGHDPTRDDRARALPRAPTGLVRRRRLAAHAFMAGGRGSVVCTGHRALGRLQLEALRTSRTADDELRQRDAAGQLRVDVPRRTPRLLRVRLRGDPEGLLRDPSIADGEQRELAIEIMRDNASRVPVVMAARVGRTFGVFRPFQQMHLDRDRNTPLWVIRLGFFTYWVLLPLAVAGAVIARRRKVPIYPLLAFPLTVLLSVLLTFGQTRYRAPAEIPLALLAAVAIETGFRRWQARGRRPSAVSESEPADTETGRRVLSS